MIVYNCIFFRYCEQKIGNLAASNGLIYIASFTAFALFTTAVYSRNNQTNK